MYNHVQGLYNHVQGLYNHVLGLYNHVQGCVHHVQGPCTMYKAVHPCTRTMYHVRGCTSMYEAVHPCTSLVQPQKALFQALYQVPQNRAFEACSTVDQARFDWSARSDISRSGPPDLRTSGPSDMPLLAVVNPRLIYGRTALRRPCFRPSTRYHRTRPFEGCSTVDQARFDWSARSDTSRSG